MSDTKKSLGQHWLFDRPTLDLIAAAASVVQTDTVLEIGPGFGSLTKVLALRARKVIAVEKDAGLTRKLNSQLPSNVDLVIADILKFNLGALPKGYKVVANIPYYLTSNLLHILLESPNPPSEMALLVQKEVAERITAKPPNMSVLALSVQYYAVPSVIKVVPRVLFDPPPKVDSALIRIIRRDRPAFMADSKRLFRIIKAGFSSKRKQLKNSLSSGLNLAPEIVVGVLGQVGVKPQARAQELGLADWQRLYRVLSDTL